MHFNADSEEFNQLATTMHLFLGSPNVTFHPSMSKMPPQSSLQPHPNIHQIPLQNIANYGWDQAPLDHPNP